MGSDHFPRTHLNGLHVNNSINLPYLGLKPQLRRFCMYEIECLHVTTSQKLFSEVKSIFCLDVNPTSTRQKFGQACSDSSLLGSKHENPGFNAHGNYTCLYRVSQEECAILRESVPYVKLYRYNPKHLYPKLNGYGDNGQRSLKL